MPANSNKGLIPLYSRIESLLRNKIFSGQYRPGEQLPIEEELASQYEVSKITIRGALAGLEADNLIVRIRGKGTFVAEELPIQKQFIATGSVYNIVEDAERYDVQVLGIDTVKVRDTRNPREIIKFFDYSEDDSINVVRRVRVLKDEPIFFLENFIPVEIAKNLTVEELSERPLLKILKDKMPLTLGKGEMSIEAISSEPDVVNTLNIQLFDPVILVKVCYWFPSGEPFEIVNLFMRSDYFKYKVELAGLSI